MIRYLVFAFSILAVSCDYSDKEILLYERNENWGEWHAGDTTSIQYQLKAYIKGNDTIYYTTNFYPNGVVKCKTIHINDHLDKVFFVNDTSGHGLDFGKIENGNGHVKVYDFQGTLTFSGNYYEGNREGWWMEYNFSGPIMDSILYKDGFFVSSPDYQVLETVFGLAKKTRSNLYH